MNISKGVIRSNISRNDINTQLANEKKKSTNNDLQNIKHTTKIDQYELLTKPRDSSGFAQGSVVPVSLVINHLTSKSCWTLVNTNNI